MHATATGWLISLYYHRMDTCHELDGCTLIKQPRMTIGIAPPHYFGGQGWAKAQPGHVGNRTKEEVSCWVEYLILWLRNPIYYRGLYIVINKQ